MMLFHFDKQYDRSGALRPKDKGETCTSKPSELNEVSITLLINTTKSIKRLLNKYITAYHPVPVLYFANIQDENDEKKYFSIS